MAFVDFKHSYMSRFRFDSFYETTGSEQAIQKSKCFLRAFEVGPAALSIWGSVGNGKTHLLGAVCNRILYGNPEVRISVASMDLNEPIDFTCNVVVLDSGDLYLRSGQLSVGVLRKFREHNISLLISSVVQPSMLLSGLSTVFQNYFEGEIGPPSPTELTQFVDLRHPSVVNRGSLEGIDSFRRAEAEITKARMRQELFPGN